MRRWHLVMIGLSQSSPSGSKDGTTNQAVSGTMQVMQMDEQTPQLRSGSTGLNQFVILTLEA
ncbi:hypothetical protein M422DRAFT_37970 [Sphaerobolus stellatus SS14]|uniref:Uncharacterized protein n=1 Tax=Sphaerobolus stellatus (strain SS14) TaxID=990650 RepID=A0A0C9TYY9_SPHS4|nr:hypothetical protein M422DRAFT_37970 [Sphaerobolus stellatus SS14]